MKKSQSSFRKDLPPAKLYLEDIQAIVDALKEDNQEGVAIEVTGFELESIDEVEKLEPQLLSKLRIRDKGYRITVSLSRHPEIWARDDTTWARGVADKVFDVVYKSRRKSQLFWRRPYLGSAVYGGAVGLFLFYIPWTVVVGNKSHWIYAAVSVLVGLVLTVWSWRGDLEGATVIPRYRATQKSFLERNKDQLIVGVILVLIGAVAGAAGTWFVAGLGK